MIRVLSGVKIRSCFPELFAVLILAAGIGCNSPERGTESLPGSGQGQWEAIGAYAAETALNLIAEVSAKPSKEKLIVMTNAGYAESNGASTQGALDGLSSVTGASRGKNTLIEIRCGPWTPLWFAVFDKESGYCAYLEPNSAEAVKPGNGSRVLSPALFSIAAAERIDAGYLFEHASDYNAKFDSRIFGGNEFRIVSIANVVAAGAPEYVVRSMEVHNHYCPGLTSGILMAQYVKNRFPSPKSGYFVQALEPYCKEDALMLLLNASPATKSYAVIYPTDSDKAARVPEARNASTIVYRKREETGRWEGLVLGFEWAETSCPQTGNDIVDKVCQDLWYLQRLGKPEDFVTVVKEFELPEGVSPVDLTHPHADPLKGIGLAR
jgi:formylmethanofuran dehydrogenase subunit E-like metal-binding protein